MSEAYVKAKKAAERDYHRAVASGSYPYLPALDDILDQAAETRTVPLGLAEIPLSLIAGTKTRGRQNAFSASFLPLLSENSEFAAKWSQLYEAQRTEGIRDPIRVYEYMNRYYVLEGNKRVSVSRFAGAYSLSADVTRILPPKTEAKASRIYYEYVDFHAVTGIFEISFSETGRFKRLAELMGETLDRSWPEEKVRLVKSAYYHFSKNYAKKRYAHSELTNGDAFLVYLTFFPADSLVSMTDREISGRIDKIRDELRTLSNEQPVMLLEDNDTENSRRTLLNYLSGTAAYTAEHPLKAAFLYAKSPENSRWAYAHELGRNHVERVFPGWVETFTYTDCADEVSSEKALEDAVSRGAELIFTTSSAMMPAALRAELAHPEVRILNCSVNLRYHAVRTYYPRLFEAKFLLGALAASLSPDGALGYIAGYPLLGDISCVNAFAIGAAMVRPGVRVSLKWSGLRDRDWYSELQEERVRMISGPDYIRPDEERRLFGLFRVNEDGSVFRIASASPDWGRFYEKMIYSVLNGTWDRLNSLTDSALNYWWGLKNGVIDLTLSKDLSRDSMRLVDMLQRSITSGEASPFSGLLMSRDGRIQGEGAPKLNSLDIVSMNWLNENVDGEIPGAEAFGEDAALLLRRSGAAEGR